MSIINDALKKAQVSLRRKDKKAALRVSPQVPVQTQGSPPFSSKNEKIESENNKTQRLFSIVTIAAALIIVGGGIYIFQLNASKASSSITLDKITPQTPPAPKKLKPAPKRTYDSDELSLSGTMMMGSKRVALINDGIYEIGQSVNGKKITNITLKEVELLDKEKKILLKVGN